MTAVLVAPLASNLPHRLYEGLGFRPVGRRRFGEDDCLVCYLGRAEFEAAAILADATAR